MKYDFLLKARSNPDLQDFCDYLTKPLQTLEELEYRYKSLPLDIKVKSENMMIHLKIDKIINKYLPNMVDNYCDFSFKYRNENFVKAVNTKDGEKSYTAKEVLLQNLSKLLEEINVLEEEFNGNNKFQLLVQEKILTNLGYATDLDESPSKIVLENKFKYKAEDIFKKTLKELPKKVKANLASTIYNGTSFVEVLLVVGFIALAGVMVFNTHIKIELKSKITTETVNLNMLTGKIKLLYSAKEDYTSLNNTIIYSARIVPDTMTYNNSITNSFGGTVSVKPSINPSEFDIVYAGVPNTACNKLVENVSAKFSKITIGAYTIQDAKENISFNPIKLSDVCNLNSTRNANIVFTSY